MPRTKASPESRAIQLLLLLPGLFYTATPCLGTPAPLGSRQERTIEHAKGVTRLGSTGRVSKLRRRGWRLRLAGALRWRAASWPI